MKRFVAVSALIGFALLASGCSPPYAYTIHNHTQSDLTVVITISDCSRLPEKQREFLYEEAVRPMRTEREYDSVGANGSASCIRVLRPDRSVILQDDYEGDEGGYSLTTGEWIYPNTYSIDDLKPISSVTMPEKAVLTGPSFPERISDFGNSASTMLLILVLVALGISFGLLFMVLFYGLPIYLAYLLVRAVVSLFRKPKPPLN